MGLTIFRLLCACFVLLGKFDGIAFTYDGTALVLFLLMNIFQGVGVIIKLLTPTRWVVRQHTSKKLKKKLQEVFLNSLPSKSSLGITRFCSL